MRACLALLSLASCSVGCGAIPAPPGWPAIWPEWEHDPAQVLDVPPAPGPEPAGAEFAEESELPNGPMAAQPEAPLAGEAHDANAARDPEEPAVVPEGPAARETAGELSPVAQVDPAAVVKPAAEVEPTDAADVAEPAPTGGEPGAPADEPAEIPVNPGAAPGAMRAFDSVLDATWSLPGSEAAGRVRDLFVKPDSGAVLAVLVADAAGNEHLVVPGALRWAGGPSPELAAALPPVDTRELYAAEDLVDLTGVVTALEDAGTGARLMVRDAGNLLHRVDVPARELLERALPALKSSATVFLRAAPSRDGEGKVWIPASLTAGDTTVTLRDEQGVPIWGELCRDLESARALVGASIRAMDADWTVAGWTFDPVAGRLVSLELAGAERFASAPWDSLPAGWSW